MNSDRLIADAKKEVLALAASGYVQPQQRTDILALGQPAPATFKLELSDECAGSFGSRWSDWRKLARILTGRSEPRDTRVRAVPPISNARLSSLAGMRKTQDRMAHMLKSGKPLRN
jgi:3-hydroxyacyl-CoA dehydrogenase